MTHSAIRQAHGGEHSRTTSSGLKSIKCAFCRGSGRNPHFGGTCPVCKGKGENQIRGKFMTCRDCRGLGKKRGTILTCYTCGGLGVVPGEEKPKALGNERELIENLKAENKRLQKRFSESKRDTGSRKSQGIESAIGSYCEDCALGENRECWDIECALAPFSPVASR